MYIKGHTFDLKIFKRKLTGSKRNCDAIVITLKWKMENGIDNIDKKKSTHSVKYGHKIHKFHLTVTGFAENCLLSSPKMLK